METNRAMLAQGPAMLRAFLDIGKIQPGPTMTREASKQVMKAKVLPGFVPGTSCSVAYYAFFPRYGPSFLNSSHFILKPPKEGALIES